MAKKIESNNTKTSTKSKTITKDTKKEIVPNNEPIVHEKVKKNENIKKSSTKKKKTNNLITDKKKKKIIADYLENPNYHEVGRLNGVSYNSVKRIVNNMSSKEDTNVSQLIIQKKEDNTNSVLEYIDSLAQTKKDLVSNILIALNKKAANPDFMTTFKDLATGLGIIVDKEYKAAELALKREEIELKREELALKKKEMEKVNNPETFNSIMDALKKSTTPDLWKDDEKEQQVIVAENNNVGVDND